MAMKLYSDTDIQNIANAIRSKNGSSDTYKVSQMASAISAIPSGGITPTGTKTITANGTGIDVYNYQYADVAVPNSYSAGDEGKVVSNGALVAQSSDTVTANDTYDTTLINSLTVNVSGGGETLPYPAGSFHGDAAIHVTCKYGHLKVECLTARQSTYIRLYGLSVNTTINESNNRPTVFTIPSGATCVLTYSNVVNSSNLQWNANFKQANSTSSLSYGIGNGTHLSGETVTVTQTNAVDIGTLFVYVANMAVGNVLEFDLSFTVNGTRYF